MALNINITTTITTTITRAFTLINNLLTHYLSISDLLRLTGLNKEFQINYNKDFIWKILFNRDYSDLASNQLLENKNQKQKEETNKNYFNCYSMLYRSKYRCCHCYLPFLPEEDRYLVMCNCLNLSHYLYAHKGCLKDLTPMHKNYYYKCNYCQKRKPTLIVKIYSF